MLFILILLLTAVAQYFLPWWMFAVVPFAVACWRSRSAGGAFGAGFLAIALLWAGVAFWQSNANDNLLAGRMANLLPVGGSTLVLLLLTALLGGLVGGVAAWAGYLSRRALT